MPKPRSVVTLRSPGRHVAVELERDPEVGTAWHVHSYEVDGGMRLELSHEVVAEGYPPALDRFTARMVEIAEELADELR